MLYVITPCVLHDKKRQPQPGDYSYRFYKIGMTKRVVTPA